MDRIRNKYNPEVSRLKAEAAVKEIDEDQHKAWLVHPCTKSLRYTIEAGLDNLVLQWVRADFAKDSFEGTALVNSRSTGMTTALETILWHMDEMLDNTQSEEDLYEEAINSTGGKSGNY